MSKYKKEPTQFSIPWVFGGLFASIIEPPAYLFELLSLMRYGRPSGLVEAIRNVDYGMLGKELNQSTNRLNKVRPLVYTYFIGRFSGYALYGFLLAKILK